jgi:predicted MFS family arabinose efflux permease
VHALPEGQQGREGRLRPTQPPLPLRRNRDFTLLWTGLAVSTLGSRISSTAYPLLVLAVTGSAADAGIVGFLQWVPFLLFQLPAGALVDRWDRKRVMVASDVVRLLALLSLAVALLGHRVSLAQIMIVAFLEGCGHVFFELSEQGAVRQVVSPLQLPDALARNEARNRGAALVGRPTGGVLFGLGRAVPFLVDVLSYLVSIACVLLIRTRFQEERVAERRNLPAEIAEGFRWLWSHAFLRTTLLLVASSNAVFQAAFIVVIVIAKEHGASPAEIGLMLGGAGLGGLAGALAAPWLQRRLPAKGIVIGANWVWAALVPLFALATNPYVLGAIFALTAFVGPAWNVIIGSYQLSLIPDRVLARVMSVDLLFAYGAIPLGALGGGLLSAWLGGGTAALVLAAVIVATAIVASASPAIRRAPTLEEAQLAAASRA